MTDYEIGWKPTFFDGHMRAQLGVLLRRLYKNFQLSFGTPDAPTMSFIRNAGGTTVLYGVEAGDPGGVRAAFVRRSAARTSTAALGSTLVADPVSGLPSQLSGRQAPLAPPWTAQVGAQYVIELPNGKTLTPRIDYSYIGGQWATPYQDLGDFLPARNLVNATLVYDSDPLQGDLLRHQRLRLPLHHRHQHRPALRRQPRPVRHPGGAPVLGALKTGAARFPG